MRKFFFSFLLILLIIITSIAYLGNISRVQFNEYAIKLSLIDDGKNLIKNDSLVTLKKRTKSNSIERYNYLGKYPFLNKCSLNTGVNSNSVNSFINNNSSDSDDSLFDYSQPTSNDTHETRVIKGIMVYFPIEQNNDFVLEFKWLYRSWIEMQKHEPVKWRTDLIVFIFKDENYFNKSDFFFNEMNCSFSNRRNSDIDRPMCTLIEYVPIRQRKFNLTNAVFADNRAKYDFLLNHIDIFDENEPNISIFYSFLKEKLSNYGYADSILMAFDGYSYLTKAGYHYIVRSDMDVFLTPLFSKWLPRKCNDFYVGRGGYSSTFNINRLRRISSDMGLSYASKTNLGSTWYSTPNQFRLISYLTLFGMAYMSEEEFTPPEREGKLGVLLWPYWHYGVLLLYGQNLFMNHLIATKQMNIVKLQNHLDYPAYFNDRVDKMLHIHVFHGDGMFSKFQFKAGKYDSMDYSKQNTEIAKFYALKMALEGKRTKNKDLYQLFVKETAKKK